MHGCSGATSGAFLCVWQCFTQSSNSYSNQATTHTLMQNSSSCYSNMALMQHLYNTLPPFLWHYLGPKILFLALKILDLGPNFSIKKGPTLKNNDHHEY